MCSFARSNSIVPDISEGMKPGIDFININFRLLADKPISGLLFILDRSTCFEIKYQVSDVPPKKRKTQEDKETEKVEVESTGGGFDAGGGVDIFFFVP